MASRAPVTDIAAERLSRLDTEIAALEAKLAGKVRDRRELARAWGYGQGYCAAVSPDQMRAVVRQVRHGAETHTSVGSVDRLARRCRLPAINHTDQGD